MHESSKPQRPVWPTLTAHTRAPASLARCSVKGGSVYRYIYRDVRSFTPRPRALWPHTHAPRGLRPPPHAPRGLWIAARGAHMAIIVDTLIPPFTVRGGDEMMGRGIWGWAGKIHSEGKYVEFFGQLCVRNKKCRVTFFCGDSCGRCVVKNFKGEVG